MRLRVKNSNMFLIPNNEHMLHLGTISKGLREFWIMLCVSCPCIPTCFRDCPRKNKCYIEEYVATSVDFGKDVFGHFKMIEDDEFAEELARFAEKHKLTDMVSRMSELQELGKVHWMMQ